MLRNSRTKRGHARKIQRIGGLCHTTQDHFIEPCGIEGSPNHDADHGGARQIRRSYPRQTGSHLGKRCAHSGDDHDRLRLHFSGEAARPAERFSALNRRSTTFCSLSFSPTP